MDFGIPPIEVPARCSTELTSCAASVQDRTTSVVPSAASLLNINASVISEGSSSHMSRASASFRSGNAEQSRRMPFNRHALITLALLALASTASGQTGPAARPLAITHAAIIDTGNGSIQRDRTILVRDGRIARIDQAGAALPADAEQLDARGAFAIPGLWDLHVHLSWATV